MRKTFLKVGVCLIAVMALVSCGGGNSSSLPKTVDFKMLSNKEEVQKIYDEILTRYGENLLAKTDEVKIFIERRSKEGMIKKASEPDAITIWVDTQDPKNVKQLLRNGYYSDWNGEAGWRAPEQMEVQVSGDAENFRLDDHLFNFKEKVSFDTFFKVLTDAYNKALDADKYTYQYIKYITISQEGYSIDVFGILSANDQEKSQYFKADFDGKFKK
ncbi:MAG: hypothetical protein LBT29_07795 [Flavobacteriaceae bacterium]|jgi:hypothetical protein|nr:hypothetical protein [Flavobacteriaceae bacterium]